jgi:hypothetical protein
MSDSPNYKEVHVNNKMMSYLLILSLMLNAFGTLRITGLQRDLNHQQNLISNIQNQVNTQINSIYANVDEKLKAQASLLEMNQVTFGEMDEATLMVPATVAVTPKRYVVGMEATLIINGQETFMKLDTQYGFSGSQEVSVFEDLAIVVAFEHDGVREVEALPKYSPLKYDYIPNIYGHYNGSWNYTGNQYELNGNVIVNLNPGRYSQDLVSLTVLELVDGKTIQEHPAELTSPDLWIPLKHKFALEKNQTYQIVVLAEDHLGLVHRYIVHEVKINAEGMFLDMGFEDRLEIRKKDGSLVYKSEGQGW